MQPTAGFHVRSVHSIRDIGHLFRYGRHEGSDEADDGEEQADVDGEGEPLGAVHRARLPARTRMTPSATSMSPPTAM